MFRWLKSLFCRPQLIWNVGDRVLLGDGVTRGTVIWACRSGVVVSVETLASRSTIRSTGNCRLRLDNVKHDAER